MAPRNCFRMQDDLVSVLAGNLDDRAELRIPILAFRITYYLLSVADRLGVRTREAVLSGLAR